MFRQRILELYSSAPISNQASFDGFVFRKLAEKELVEAEFCRPRLKLFRDRMSQGFDVFGYVSDEGTLAYYMWLCLGRKINWAPWALGAQIEVPSSSGYIFDCKTDTPYRNKGLYKAALKEGRRLCYQANCEMALIDVVPSNEPAVRAIKAAGFQMKSRIAVTKFGPLYKTTQDNKSRYSLGHCSYILD